jgi:hypothetical protein
MNPSPFVSIPPEHVLPRIESREFVLVNDAGSTVASLGVDKTQQPVLSLFGPSGAPRLTLELADGLPTIVLRDGADIIRAVLAVGRAGDARLTMLDRAGRERIELGTGDEGEAAVQVLGAEGEIRAELATELDGETTLFLYGADAQPRIALIVADGDSTILSLDDPDGKNAILLAATSEGDRKLIITDRDDRPRVFAGIEAGEEPEVGIIDKP